MYLVRNGFLINFNICNDGAKEWSISARFLGCLRREERRSSALARTEEEIKSRVQ
jgi:hypothetical protein